MIHVKKLTYRYPGRSRDVLREVQLSLGGGSIAGLFGPNGVGKTTLFQLWSGLLFPTRGSVEVLGHSAGQRRVETLGQLFYLPETPWFPGDTATALARRVGTFYPQFTEEYFADLLTQFGRSPHERLGRLSMGERKQVYLAFALACRTPLLLLDEPTNGLDIEAKNRLRKMLVDHWAEDRLLVLATHQALDVEGLIDHLLILQHDQLVLDAPLSELEEELALVRSNKAPATDDALISERTPEGWVSLLPRSGVADGQKLPLELLYRAVMQQPSFFQARTQKNAHYDT